jgi:hypothetical protein
MTTIKNTPAKVGGFTVAAVAGAFRAEVNARKAADAILTKGESTTAEKLKALLPRDAKGKLVPVTLKQWSDAIGETVKAGLTQVYPDGYGPRLTWAKVFVLGQSRGKPGRASLGQYYEDVKDVLIADGILSVSKRGAQVKVGGTKADAAAKGKVAALETQAAKGDKGAQAKLANVATTRGPIPPTSKGAASKGVTVADGAEWRAAALLVFGSPALASKCHELFSFASGEWNAARDSFVKDVNERLERLAKVAGK